MDTGIRKPHRILHVIDSLDLGGAQTVLVNIAKHLPRERFVVEVAAMHGRGVFASEIEQLGIPVHFLSNRKVPPEYLWQLPILLHVRNYDLVHFHLFGSNWLGKPLSALCGVRALVSHDHCNDRFRHEKKVAVFLDTLTNQLSQLVLGVSQSTCDFLTEVEGLPEERVRLLYNGVDTEDFVLPDVAAVLRAKQKLGLDPTRPVLGGVGRLVEQKNFFLWLEVAAAMKKRFPVLQFLLAGTGPQEAMLRQVASDFGLDKDVMFAGFVEDRQTLYHAFDVLLITSDYEGLPMTLLEAMACGVPVVASAVDGLQEILVSEQDGLLAPPGRADGFEQAVERVLQQPSLREGLVQKAREKVVTQFSAKAQVNAVAEIYEELLAEGRKIS